MAPPLPPPPPLRSVLFQVLSLGRVPSLYSEGPPLPQLLLHLGLPLPLRSVCPASQRSVLPAQLHQAWGLPFLHSGQPQVLLLWGCQAPPLHSGLRPVHLLSGGLLLLPALLLLVLLAHRLWACLHFQHLVLLVRLLLVHPVHLHSVLQVLLLLGHLLPPLALLSLACPPLPLVPPLLSPALLQSLVLQWWLPPP